jgi:hypothetical protein
MYRHYFKETNDENYVNKNVFEKGQLIYVLDINPINEVN